MKGIEVAKILLFGSFNIQIRLLLEACSAWRVKVAMMEIPAMQGLLLFISRGRYL